MNKFSLFLFALTVFLPTTVMGNGAASVADGLVNKSGVAEDQAIPTKGREYTLEAAGRDTNTGAAVAGATGAALTGAATAHFLMGDWITGGTLMTMAAMEFAQMGASSNAAKQHLTDRSVLMNPYTSNPGTSASGSNGNGNSGDFQRPELPANFENWLAKSGVDPEQFKSDLFGGKFTDPQSVLTTLGRDTSRISNSDLEKAQKKAEAEFGKISAEVMASLGSGGMLASSQESKSSSKSDLEKEKNNEHPVGERIGSRATPPGSGQDGDPAAYQNYMNGLFGVPTPGGMTQQDQSLLFESYLKEQGLVPTRPGQNIFQVAQQNYRSYARWRNKSKGTKRQVSSMN